MAERDLDNTGMLGELRRMVQTTGTVGGIAARFAGHKMGLRSGGASHAEDLKSVLGGLKGPLMKAAQLLSTIPGALPDDYAKELAELQANAPPMGWNFVRRRMTAELGAGWEKNFRSFGREAAAAASLGQVHQAVLTDGRRVACKLQYPDMKAAVESDLRQFRMAIGVYHRLDNAIRQDDVVEELTERLREELDYRREAANMRLYRAILADCPEVTVPAPIDEFSTQRLLTMEWVSGRGLNAAIEAGLTEEQKQKIARSLFRAWYLPLYQYGVVHGDPHMGNFTLRDDYGLNLLDFGAIRIFNPSFIKGNIDLYRALQTGNKALATEAYAAWGFDGLTSEKVDVLNEWAGFLFAPLMDDRERFIQEDTTGVFGRDVLTKVHEGLQRTGGVKLPREFVLVDRSAVGLGSVFMRLKVKMNWYQLFHEIIAEFDEQALAARQKAAIEAARFPEPPVV
ncbi:ABC1 kinase family protein [Acetobacter indonesiensis]|uniref:ABC transporter n=1 Tax=Acetobacter indonesiensis TaxID=104101 RepID=A0A252AXS1_9PROT|nr:AarF/ABC1/UbiB kinase family protein [Acetobacter indonesiensis]MCP1229824.1 AarF/ABC1/UbiB kinase family protein [Acetobacter indonesiensis]OUI96353.1 ABC transporter ATP-binding protein [Acetobacter indonesiensis]GAN63427.1 ABC transporter [Acetobacter indonesiensis]GBQ61206.1 ABC transporter ATP-binding protein [Acetobacter indonesiensis NRIC 0313]GEN03545.1 ABC transporter ATP-binding protein [Acetobacter indonesiensis]